MGKRCPHASLGACVDFRSDPESSLLCVMRARVLKIGTRSPTSTESLSTSGRPYKKIDITSSRYRRPPTYGCGLQARWVDFRMVLKIVLTSSHLPKSVRRLPDDVIARTYGPPLQNADAVLKNRHLMRLRAYRLLEDRTI